MSIEIIEASNGAVLTDTVDGMAFGPVFDTRDEAVAFVRWFEAWRAARGWTGRLTDIGVLKRMYYDGLGGVTQKLVADYWRTAIDPANHTPQTCPLCHPDYPHGYVAEVDSDDGSGTYLAVCGCTCHEGPDGRNYGRVTQ